MKFLSILLATTVAASAQSAPQLSVKQCIEVLAGLSSLNFVGQLNPTQTPPADAKQYKLGEARFTIALNIGMLQPVAIAYQRGQQAFMAEQPSIPAAEAGKPPPPDVQRAINDQNKAFAKFQLDALSKPCPATLGRLKLSDLKLGDGPDQNAIPPGVLAAFSPIVDK